MNERTFTFPEIEKSKWGEGPWLSEPDKVQWIDDATGLPCLAVRAASAGDDGGGGHWCGYVGVAKGHPLFGREYDSPDVSVHGGLTYAALCNEQPDNRGICHIPEPGQPDHVWWFGFDCAHCDDVAPAYRRLTGIPSYGTYRTLDYVKSECASLAQQLKALASS